MIADPIHLARRAGPLLAAALALTLVRRAVPLLAAALALSGCARHASSPEGLDERAPVSATVFTAGGTAMGPGLVVPGRIKAREEITLTARLAARVTALPVREGGHFRAGEPLALFDAPETRSAIRAARSGLDAATLRLALARRQQARMESLFAAGVVARRDLELAEADARGAEADSAQARANAEQWLSGTSIPAPFDGVVVRRRVDVGAGVEPGAALLDLRSEGAGKIEAPVPESAVESVRSARAYFQIDEGPWMEATLARLDGMTDFSTRTRTAHLRAPGRALEAGRFVRVRFEARGTGRSTATAPRLGTASPPVPTTSASTAPARSKGAPPPAPSVGAAPPAAAAPGPLAVPTASIVRRGALAGVYVIADGRAELRWLRLGRTAGDRVEVLAGLWSGEQVAARPEGLTDGRRVTVAR